MSGVRKATSKNHTEYQRAKRALSPIFLGNSALYYLSNMNVSYLYTFFRLTFPAQTGHPAFFPLALDEMRAFQIWPLGHSHQAYL